MIKSALILLLCAAPILAQTERHAALGDRIRVSAPKSGYGRLTGQVIATTPDVIQLRLDGGTEVPVMRAQIDKLLLSISSHSNTTKGATIGAVIGGVGAFLFGPKRVGPTQPPGTGKVPTIDVVTSTVLGGAVGALVGFYVRSDRWIALSPRP